MTALEQDYDKGYDRDSTILGRPCRIMQPLGTPKAKEDCEPFTFTLYPPLDLPMGVQYMIRPEVRQMEDAAEARKPVEKMLASGAHLAARCSRCEKKGKNCSESRSASVRQACIIRQCGKS